MNIKNNIWIAICLLVGSIVFNLWLYRMEPTATIDPNDNAFQYALIDRTNTIWDYASRTCPKNITSITCHVSYLTDHWVPNWAEGYNLPYYYSHIPQILIVGSYRLFHLPISLFQYYHIIIYLFLCFFPLSIFLAFRMLKFPWLTAGIAALVASQISTDGLYGIDPPSFLWRGWGLSSQLFALMWLPLAIASAIRYTTVDTKRKLPTSLILTVLFLVLTTSGHLGIGMMAFMAVGVICLTPAITGLLAQHPLKRVFQTAFLGIKHTAIIAIPALLLLSYWIVPAFMKNDFHNISVWDPVWKFNSFGAIEVVTKLVNGELFDFGRFPLFTVLILLGLFVAIRVTTNNKQHDATTEHPETALSFMFVFFLLLLFGKTTWGNLLNLIPGMSEFHGHRFIVGLHLAGLFLAPIGLIWIIDRIGSIRTKTTMQTFLSMVVAPCCLIVGACIILVPQTIRYAAYNDTLIVDANETYANIQPDTNLLFGTLKDLIKERPGRVFALRGTEGRNFRMASTAYYMQLSTFGIPTVLWLPETWSPNSDTEQFFSEDNETHFDLYNIAYIVTPPDKKPPSFWHLMKETDTWKLYTITPSMDNAPIGVGTSPSVVYGEKQSFINLIHLWIQSAYPKQYLYPEIQVGTNTRSEPSTSLPNFTMKDEVTYETPDGALHTLFAELPAYQSPLSFPLPMSIVSQSSDTDMVFSARVEITKQCPTCVVLLKHTYHPSWKATVNGKRATVIAVFPFFSAIRLETLGTYDIVFSYTPSGVKHILFLGGSLGLIAGLVFFFISFRRRL